MSHELGKSLLIVAGLLCSCCFNACNRVSEKQVSEQRPGAVSNKPIVPAVSNDVLARGISTDSTKLVSGQSYPVEDFLDSVDYGSSIEDVIKSHIAPNSWEDAGGRGVLRIDSSKKTIFVAQTRTIHAEIQLLLAQLRNSPHPDQPVFVRGRSDAVAKIVTALNQETQFQFVNTPLSDVMEFLADLHKINIRFDESALKDEGIATDEPINVQLSGIPLQSALNILLTPFGLTYVIGEDSLRITNEEISESYIYRIPDIAADPKHVQEVVELIQFLMTDRLDTNKDGEWIHHVASAKCLLVAQTRHVHQEIRQLVRRLRKPKPGQPVNLFPSGSGRIERILTDTTEFKFVDTPLRVGVAQLAKRHGFPIILDEKALGEEGISIDEPITLALSGISLNSALKIILEPLGLTYEIKDDELIITTTIAAEELIDTYLYSAEGLADANGLLDKLIDLIKRETTGPWFDVEGTGGTISFFSPGNCLLIRQAHNVHSEIRILLRILRQSIKPEQPVNLYWPPEAEAKIVAALEKPVSLHFVDKALDDLLSHIEKTCDINIVLDNAALVDEGIAADAPVSIHCERLRLKNVLRLILRPLGLTHYVWSDVLRIDTQIGAEEIYPPYLYAIDDIATDKQDVQQLVKCIQRMVVVGWHEIDGFGGYIYEFNSSSTSGLVICHLATVRPEIASLLRQLRRREPRDMDPSRKRLEDALQTRVKTPDPNHTKSLAALITTLAEQVSIDVDFPPEMLDKANPGLPQKDLTLDQALQQLGVRSYFKAGKLGVGEPPKFDWEIYPLADSQQVPAAAVKLQEQLLREVSPKRWSLDESAVFYVNGCFAIRQTVDVHRAISQWFKKNAAE